MTSYSEPEGSQQRLQAALQQAQAAASAQTDTTSSITDGASIRTTDLVTPELAEGDVAPPAYVDSPGEIRDQKSRSGTSARVTDDGRVDIRINEINRMLSQIFSPALSQQVQDVKGDRPPPPPYVPPSLGGADGTPPPPPLNVVIQVVGSRGDVQPFVALGKVLRDVYGHRVRLATHPNFKAFVEENGLEFFSIGGDPSQLMAFMVKNPGLMPGFRSIMSGDVTQQRKNVADYIQGCWRSCYQAGDGMNGSATNNDGKDVDSQTESRPFVADCIIANPPSFAHIHCAEKLGIPLHMMFTMPYTPTQAFPHPLANIKSSNADPQLTNYMSYAMVELLSWQGLGDIINRFRRKCLGLEPISQIWAPGMLHRLRIPYTYCWSPALIPKPKDWGPQTSVAGFYFLKSASSYTPPVELQKFLNDGPPPVYIGFGSIVLDDPDAMTELILKAAKLSGQRVLLSKGWGGMGADTLQVPENVFMLGNIPHDWLFEHVSCVVHHGGAGTTAAGISAGRPTVVVPFFGDQAFWGAMVARAGAGPDPIPQKQLTAERLANAIRFCLKPESLERAKELASKIASEKGDEAGAQSFHQNLEVDRLRCTFAPSRPAAWRIKRTQIKLSAFAACTLANANLLDFGDLKLFRPSEYNIDEGPWDPVSGGAAASYRTFSNMMLGLAEVPSETLKPWYNRSKSDGQPSQRSVVANPISSSNSDLSRTRIPQGSQEMAAPAKEPSEIDPADKQPTLDQNDRVSRSNSSYSTSNASKQQNVLHQATPHTSRGLGRVGRATIQAPMDVSMSLTKGFHNMPKLWGDDTVRPQGQVRGFKSSAIEMSKEFGYGWYDGFTGLVTQPYRGAQKEGTIGLLKGIGKGFGGFAFKPFAGVSAVISHPMKGLHKELQKLYGSNVQTYIVSSRVAQGYEEWQQSTEVEKQDVVDRWKLIQKYVKGKGKAEDLMQDVLDTHRKQSMQGTNSTQSSIRGVRTIDTSSTYGGTQDMGSDELAENVSHVPNNHPQVAELMGEPGQNTALSHMVNNTNVELGIEDNNSAQGVEEDELRRAIAASEIEAQRQASEAQEFDKQLRQVMTASIGEQRDQVPDGVCDRSTEIVAHEDWRQGLRSVDVEAQSTAGPSSQARHPPAYDLGHVAGTTRDDFESQQADQRGEKTAQEKTEEEIVLQYIKKQSLLEAQHREQGRARGTRAEAEEDEELQRVLKLSMQDSEPTATS